ncbi:hypothetical protein QTP81_16080 [Alteromonas sp. ASW11-36]|uniref:Argininosuccinate lyase n=1 Tax=Alteromonas arenosi TaxID=3055817 RepID=A0ABT7T2Y5_9ALTE|nr:hypothetical protein [Alteromonas sp. ASW11-36]MDM7862124.1 hypothetical protein [Alteromonas sp. ASW11-36]
MKNTIKILGAITALLLSQLATAQSDDGKDRRISLTNDTSVTIVEFYASNIDSESWEENILDGNYLSPGNEFIINIDDGSGYCLFDLKAVFADGDVVTNTKFDVCTETGWILFEE